MKTCFIDTSFIIALEDVADQYHQIAIEYWEDNFLKTFSNVVLTSYVFNEVVTHFIRIKWHSKAVEVGNHLFSSRSTQFIHVDEELFRAGWRYFQKHKDKFYSLTDCISFLVMDRLNIVTALTFDKHFQQAGFELLP